jgi:Tfp pilus assembly protein PilP
MSASRGTAYILTVGLLAVGCSGGSSVPVAQTKIALAEQPEAAKVVAQKPASPGVAPKMPEAGPPLPPMAYEAKGRRDPFRPVDISKEKPSLEVSTVKLVGIISGRRLLALVEAPNGLGYIVKPGDVLGNGHVTDVTPNSVTFAVTGSSSPRETSLTLKLTRD